MLAIIPARGGSKGVPDKNIRPLAGKPLIVYTIEAALAAGKVTRVVVSTDSERIAEVARKAGAEVPFLRPSALAQDDSMALDVYLHACESLGVPGRGPVDAFAALLPTTPFKRAEDIDAAIVLFDEKAADSVIGVTEPSMPVSWYRRIDEKGILRCLFDEVSGAVGNRQAEPRHVVPSGAVFVMRYSLLKEKRNYYSERTYPLMIPRENSLDIDEPVDFEMAEALMSRRLCVRAGRKADV